jgi:regulator of Ty1 transposition protein 103
MHSKLLIYTDIDRSRTTRKPALGGSLFSSNSTPPELKPVEPFATAVQKADLNTKPAIATANQDYEKLTNPNNAIPTPPMHAAGLAALVKKLAVAESAVADGIKARQALISGLEKLLEANKVKLEQEEVQLADLTTRKDAIDSRKREVEQAIMKGLSAAETNKISAAPLPGLAQQTHERPNVEELTPPPMESFTPVGSPQLQPLDVPNDTFREPSAHPLEPVAVHAPIGIPAISGAATAIGAPGTINAAELLKSIGHGKPEDFNAAYGQGTYKKRKMSRSAAEDEFAAFAGDDDVNGIDSNLGDLI